MVTVDLKLCDERIFLHGEAVALLEADPREIEEWVGLIRSATKSNVDWQFTGYVAQMLHLGDLASRERVEKQIDALASLLRSGSGILKRFAVGEAGVWRMSRRKIPPPVRE